MVYTTSYSYVPISMHRGRILEAKTDCYGKDRLFVASFVFCVISYDLDLFSTSNRQNFSFVKDIYVDGKKLARNGQKTAILAGRWGSY